MYELILYTVLFLSIAALLKLILFDIIEDMTEDRK